LKRIDGLNASVSLTTRTPRENEVGGVDYHFVSEAEFNRQVAAGELAEYARVFDASYGTPRAPLDHAVGGNGDILLDIDIQGARQIRQLYAADTVTIFVLPPSFGELEGRLRKRGTEAEDAIARRLQRAREEASAYVEYDYVIVNTEVAQSLADLAAIVNTERLRVARMREGFAPWKT
jgi:guanylate kinase